MAMHLFGHIQKLDHILYNYELPSRLG